MMIGGMVVVGTSAAMVKMSQADAQKIQQSTGKAPEEMSDEELQQAMQQQGVQAQPVTDQDQQAMAAVEEADPQEQEG
jgi:parvulin-like peptidyl-prolyl isomerase